MADEKKPAKPADLTPETVARALAAAKPGDLPTIAPMTGNGVVSLCYSDPAMYAARTSVDTEALRALPGWTVVSAECVDGEPGFLVTLTLRRA